MQSLAEAYTCPSKGIGSPSRYRTPRDRAKEKETTSLPLARSLAGRRSFARCSLARNAFVRWSLGRFVDSLARSADRSIDRSRARTRHALSARPLDTR